MKTRRGPWLSGLIVALIGTVWMIGQVLGGLLSMIGDLLPAGQLPPATTAVSMGAVHTVGDVVAWSTPRKTLARRSVDR
jgi:hypothetical protein